MKLLWFILVLHTTLAAASFGKAYMRKAGLCHQWICINNKLNLPDGLPPKEDYTRVLQDLLPPGSWQEVVGDVLDTCYSNRSRIYTNTCPGQALLHCMVDQLINKCPSEFQKPHDGCAAVNSLAGFGNMFSQSRYNSMDTYLPFEARPMWFLKNYFSKACCDVPLLFNSSVLSECGFTSMLAYYNHRPTFHYGGVATTKTPRWEIHDGASDDHTRSDGLKIEDFAEEQSYSNLDPLDCCDVSNLIKAEWRQECDFKLKWEGQNRLVIDESTATTEPTTTSERPTVHTDLMLLPQSCDKTTCVFKKLGILNDMNAVNFALFAKLLDNFTTTNPDWERAKGRVITTCLERTLDYEGECEINKLLACVFDVLTENCPAFGKRDKTVRSDPCKHSRTSFGRICQISSSKYRPKNRRSQCFVPELVDTTILTECGSMGPGYTLSRVVQVNTFNTTKKYKLSKIGCKDLTPSTSCVLSKMGVLNKYGFMNYFKMKDLLKNPPLLDDTYRLEDIQTIPLTDAFRNALLYKEHCNSPRKLLNILDTKLLICPTSKRIQTAQCTKMFEDMRTTSITSKNSKKHSKHFQHVFYPSQYHTENHIHKKYSSKIIKNPLYNYGLFSKYAPKVETIDLTPKVEKKPLVLLPVYMRVQNTSLVLRPHDGTLRSGSWLQHPQIHSQQPISPITTTISTIPSVSVSTSMPISPTPVTYLRIPNSNLLIRSNNDYLLSSPFGKYSGGTQNLKYSTISPTATATNEPISTTHTKEQVVETTAIPIDSIE